MASSSSSSPRQQFFFPPRDPNQAAAQSSSTSTPKLEQLMDELDIKKVVLKSSDDDVFELEEIIAVQSGTIKNMVDDHYTLIPLPNVDTKTLVKIIDYLKMHAVNGVSEQDLKKFDCEFVNASFRNLSELVFAANYLEIKPLMELICQAIADRIKNKTVGAVRKIFNVTNDYTPEEEEEVKNEYRWAHEEGGPFDDTID